MYFWYTKVDQYFNFAITVYCDNIALTQNTGGHSKIKCVNTKTYWIREAVTLGEIIVEPILSEENIVDLFTKSLSHSKLEILIKKMGMEYLDI